MEITIRDVGKSRRQKPLQEQLRLALKAARRANVFDQTSLGHAIGKDQSTVAQYFKDDGGKAGTLDLDEAADALEHAGTSLVDFLANQPPRALSPAELLARRLAARADLIVVLEALLVVPKQRLPVVIGQIDAGVFAATGRRLIPSRGSDLENTEEARTTKGSRKRR